MKLIALWDVDGVLARTNEAVLRTFQQQGKLLNVNHSSINCYDWKFQDEVSLDELWQAYLDLDKRTLEPYEDALKAILRCDELGYEIHVVPGRQDTPRHRQETWEWLNTVGAPFDHLEFVPAAQKGQYAYEHGVSLSVEDHTETALALAAAGCYSLLVWQPWNDRGDRDLKVQRSNFWHVNMGWLTHYVNAAHTAIEQDRIKAAQRERRQRGQVTSDVAVGAQA